MKYVTFVIPNLKGNGAERVVITLAKQLMKLGHRVHIVCFESIFQFDIFDLDISIFPANKYRWIPRWIRGRALAPFLDLHIIRHLNRRPDLLLSNLLPADRICAYSKINSSYIILHNTLSFDLNSKSEINVYTQKPVICCSNGVLTDYRKLFPSYRQNSRVIFNSTDTQELFDLSREYSSDIPKGYIINIAKFKHQKRHDILLRAFAKAVTHRKLVLVGDGSLLEESKDLAAKLGISSRVIFKGFSKNPYPWLIAADLFVLSSDFEGLPTVLLEATALNVPAISSNCQSGPSDILNEIQLFPVGDIDRLAQMISVEDYSIYKSKLKKDFQPDHMANQYLNLITD